MSCMNFLKGIGAGLMVGACIGMVFKPNKKHSKKMMSRAVRAVGDVIDEFAEMMGM
ncbi:MAG: hypothetical protein LUC20_03670 [Oscillospiraceae bacterium]|nr:hypothetical protein [Oscillospiraceae bacterium]